MIKLHFTALAAAALSLVTALPASAAFSTHDWAATGDNGIIMDSTTGKQWLRGDFTSRHNTTDIMARLAEGGDLYGWRVAHSYEVAGLLSQFWTEDVLNPFSQWGNNISTSRHLGQEETFLDFYALFGGSHSYPNSYMYVNSIGYHYSDLTHTDKFPFASSGMRTTYGIYDQDGKPVNAGGLVGSGDYSLDYANNHNLAPDLNKIREDLVIKLQSEYGTKTYNTAFQGYEAPANHTHWWLVNEFATPDLVSPAGDVSDVSDVSSTLPLPLIGFTLFVWARVLRRKD